MRIHRGFRFQTLQSMKLKTTEMAREINITIWLMYGMTARDILYTWRQTFDCVGGLSGPHFPWI